MRYLWHGSTYTHNAHQGLWPQHGSYPPALARVRQSPRFHNATCHVSTGRVAAEISTSTTEPRAWEPWSQSNIAYLITQDDQSLPSSAQTSLGADNAATGSARAVKQPPCPSPVPPTTTLSGPALPPPAKAAPSTPGEQQTAKPSVIPYKQLAQGHPPPREDQYPQNPPTVDQLTAANPTSPTTRQRRKLSIWQWTCAHKG